MNCKVSKVSYWTGQILAGIYKKIIVKGKVKMIAYNLRHPGMVFFMLEEKIKRKNWVGKPKRNYDMQIMKDTRNKSYGKLR